MRRWLIALLLVLVSLAVGPSLSAAQSPSTLRTPTVAVKGEVSAPASYTPAQLAALPQTTVSLSVFGHPISVTGVLLESLVDAAQPAYPASLANSKNALLRVTITVQGESRRSVTFAMGELDSSFGNHPALLALTVDGHHLSPGPALVVPGDSLPLRFIPRVRQITVGIATAPATNTAPPSGSPVEIITGTRHVSLSAAKLAQLPASTRTVVFSGPGGDQTHTEFGPSLLTVLHAAGIWPTLNSWIAVVGDDNYAATVTSAEQWVGGRGLQLSLNEDGVALAQPRLVTAGDVKGGRYVSGVVTIYVGSGPAH